MSWEIERDKDGTPLRMFWTGPSEHPSAAQERRQREFEKNHLPMPAMREWARARGL